MVFIFGLTVLGGLILLGNNAGFVEIPGITMINFFHRLMNPHCEHCYDELRDSRVCNSCEAMRLEIEYLKHHNNKLLEALLEATAKETSTTPVASPEELKPLTAKSLPWSARRQILEMKSREAAEKREEAKLLREQDQQQIKTGTIDMVALEEADRIRGLEERLGVSDAS